MKEKKQDQRSGPAWSGNRVRGSGSGKRYPYWYRLKAVKMYLEEGYSQNIISQELGCTGRSVKRWVECYREYGEEGLRREKMPLPRLVKREDLVDEKIRQIRRENPGYGPRRISDILGRFFLLRAAPSRVHRTLKEAELIKPARKKPKKNPAKPRRFERSTPNQMWQSDIMSFRMNNKAVYLIGYIDDYSRYIVGLELYRSQTGEAVLETYRQAVGNYGCPREMLTDNGRQYATWRGKTKFQKELEKDKIHHIRSRPAHPMTLGKIERFWKSILDEFLYRAKFEDFAEARERIALWVKYYNHRRPHQGIGGLCPADRYFEINTQVKTTLDAGIEDNILEMALRGKPARPFYMVGQMGGQSVVIRAEKGKVKMLVDGQEQAKPNELTYKIERAIHDSIDKQEANQEQTHLQRGGENPGGTGNVDREAPAVPDSAGAGDHGDAAGPVAKESDVGDLNGNGAAQGRSLESAASGTPGEYPGQTGAGEAAGKACETHGGSTGCTQQAGSGSEETGTQDGSNPEIKITDGNPRGQESAQTRGGVPQGSVQVDEGGGCGQGTGHSQADLLQVGEKRNSGPEGGLQRWPRWSPVPQRGSPGGVHAKAAPGSQDPERAVEDASGGPATDGRRDARKQPPMGQIQGL